MKLKDKVAIVTGGGGGIGRGIAVALLKEGAKVTITGRTQASLDEAVAEFAAQGFGGVLAVVCDGGKRDQVKNAVAKTVEHFGTIDVMVNNAHASTQKPLESLTDDDMNLSLDSGLWATFYFMQECFPYLKEKEHGKIINFASAAGIKGQHTQAAYAAAKEGIRGLTRVAVNEWGKYGICINIIAPFAETPGVKQWAEHFPESYQASVNGVPLKRIGHSELDVGRTVVFLASEDADYITGNTIDVGGGGSMRP